LPGGQTKVKWSGQSSVLGRVISLAGGLLEPLGKKNVQKLIDGLQQALA
jgi:carbon monoxide dehydrogenase subunit G